MNKIQTREFIQQKFQEYYKQNSESIQSPASFEKREFGFLLLKERVMLRHKGFKNVGDLRNFLQSVVPSDVYYSSSYYDKPEEEMDSKGWVGADLIFDIDADHIPTSCDKRHDIWTCKNCGTSGRGRKPEKCPKCQLQKFDEINWPCDTCLESAKNETTKLIEILEKDFGFSPKEMILAFSGHRGYHVHIEHDTVKTLDSMARKEIVDYVIGLGLKPELQGFENAMGPKLEDSGWRGRIARGTYEFSLIPTQEQLEKAGLTKKTAAGMIRHKEKILESWKSLGPWKMLKSMGMDSWEEIILRGVERQSAKIDTVVTTDVHRLIRLANTLHGETGLKKIEVSVSGIERFDPFKRAVAFNQGTILIDVSNAPKFRLGDNFYGPYTDERVELPTAAAMLLLCKRIAKVAEESTLVQ